MVVNKINGDNNELSGNIHMVNINVLTSQENHWCLDWLKHKDIYQLCPLKDSYFAKKEEIKNTSKNHFVYSKGKKCLSITKKQS